MKRCILLAGLVFCAASMAAQSSTGSIYGAVVDPRGLAVAGATITIRSTDLASARSTVSNGSGGFSLAGLVPGAYTVEAAKNPLKLRRPIRLTVGLGSSTQVAIKLDIAEVKQRSTVSARGATAEGNTTTPPINQSEASISTFLAGTVVTYLPNRDRDIAQFDQLASNSHESADDDGVSIDGQRTNALMTQVDGVDFNSPLFGASRAAENRAFFLPQTVIREFQIVSSGVSAEVGQTNAGLINAATKEGSNKLHGEAFYTVRPSALTSADAFGNSPSNLMNNFGASEGGALRKSRSFFYAGFEQDFLHAPTFTQFAPQAPGSIIPSSLIGLQGQIDERDTPLALSGRVDQILKDANTLNIELAGSRIRTSNLGNGETRTLATIAASGHESGQSLFGRVGLTTVLNAHTVNQALAAYTSVHSGYTPNSTAPEFFINGFGVLGGNTLGAHLYTSRRLQVSDGVSISRGTALFTFGGDFSNDPLYEQREENLNGRFDYNSLTDFLAHQPRRFQQTFATGLTRFTGTVRELGLYANARVELHPGLTLTAACAGLDSGTRSPLIPTPQFRRLRRFPTTFRSGSRGQASPGVPTRGPSFAYPAASMTRPRRPRSSTASLRTTEHKPSQRIATLTPAS